MLQTALGYWSHLDTHERARFRFIQVSTDEVYGSLGPTDAFLETTPLAPNSPYAASKFAVVSMSEGLSLQLKPHGIGVSVLCPSFVRTGIGASERNRPERYGQSQPLDPASPAAAMVAEIARQIGAGLDPASVAERVLEAIRQDELYIFTHPGMRAQVEPRFAAILAAMDKVSAP